MSPDEMLRQPQLPAERAYLVLEQLAQRFDQPQVHAFGQATDVVVGFDGDRWSPGERYALDHVGIEGALGQEVDAPELFRFRLEHVDEKRADGLALLLRVSLAGERGQKLGARINVEQGNVEMTTEEPNNLAGLIEPQVAVVDDNAGERAANGLMEELGRTGAVHPAGQAADHPTRPDFGPDAGDLRAAKVGHAPVAWQAGDAPHKISDQAAALRRMCHLRMKLHGVELALFIGDRGERRALGDRHHLETGWQACDAIAMAHPHGVAFALAPNPLKQPVVAGDLELSAPKLAMMSPLHAAAQLSHHGLLAIADAEHG